MGAETDGWDSPGQRSIANFDEDSVSMAVAAGIDCLKGRDRDAIDGLLFASTTPPYAEKQCASIIAMALDLRRDIFTADITDVLRAGTTALKSALDSVAAGSAKQVLVVASDNRQGAPKGEAERNSGDGAVAFIVSDEEIIAEQAGAYTITENMMDTWRSAGDRFVRSWEDRFAVEEGLERIMGDAVSGFLEKEGLSVKDVSKLALYSPDARRHGLVVHGLRRRDIPQRHAQGLEQGDLPRVPPALDLAPHQLPQLEHPLPQDQAAGGGHHQLARLDPGLGQVVHHDQVGPLDGAIIQLAHVGVSAAHR